MPLPSILDSKGLADQLGITLDYLYCLSNKQNLFYRNFTLRKKTRGVRTICAPNRAMKGVQRWILSNILEQIAPEHASVGFIKGLSICDNAARHVGQRFVYNLDIKDFFPAIGRNKVFFVFSGRTPYSYSVCGTLADLTTLNGALPQGAPTSPYLSNLVLAPFDRRMMGLAKKYRFQYTRYADDLTFSGKTRPDIISSLIRTALQDCRLDLNERKTRIQRQGGRQVVTGLTVNAQVAVPRNQRKVYRSIFHQAEVNPSKFVYRRDELAGYISFLRMVQPSYSQIRRWESVLEKIPIAAGA